MITIGVDLAAEPKKTGIAWVLWRRDGTAVVEQVNLGVTDDNLVTAMSEGAKTGIDCPLGWPVKFIEFIGQHQHDHVEVTLP